MDLPHRVKPAGEDQGDPGLFQRLDDSTDISQDFPRQKPVGGNGHGAQTAEMGLFQSADPQEKLDDVVSKERFTAGDVQLLQPGEDRRFEELQPVACREFRNGRHPPDVAHEAFGDATPGHLNAEGLGPAGTASCLEKAIANSSRGETKEYSIQIHVDPFDRKTISGGLMISLFAVMRPPLREVRQAHTSLPSINFPATQVFGFPGMP